MARQAVPAFAGVPRVDLMPRSETDRRARESLVGKWVWGVLGAVIIACVVIAGAYAMTLLANQRLAAAQAETTALVTQLGALSDVSSALSTERDLTQYRADAMGADFAWKPVIDAVTTALPSHTTLTGFDVVSGGNPTKGGDPNAQVGLTGTFTVNSPTPLDMAATIRAVRTATGVMDADGEAVTVSNTAVGAYQYQLTVTFDQTIYSNDYAVKVGQ